MSLVKQILIPVTDIDAALAFYTDAMGFALKFRDGARYAALDGGGVTVALVGPEEQVAGQTISFSLHVEDMDQVLSRARASGASLLRAPQAGPHELRAVLADPDGNPVIFYKKTT